MTPATIVRYGDEAMLMIETPLAERIAAQPERYNIRISDPRSAWELAGPPEILAPNVLSYVVVLTSDAPSTRIETPTR